MTLRADGRLVLICRAGVQHRVIRDQLDVPGLEGHVEPERRIEFDSDVVHPDFASFRDRVVLADAARAAAFAGLEAQLRERFERAGTRTPDGARRFRQPMRVDVLRRPG